MQASTPVFAIEAIEDHKTVHLLVGGEVFDAQRLKTAAGVIEYQTALTKAKVTHGHALCWCKKPGLKLQIRRVEGKLHLALWPGEGQVHEHNCVFYREPIQTVSPALMHQVAPVIVKPAQPAEREHKHSMPALSDLTRMLWIQANLNRWHPKWERDWGRTRFELMRAAQHIHHAGRALADITFIPKPFRESEKNSLNAQWEGFLTDLAKSAKDGVRPNCLIIAPVKKICKQPAGLSTIHLAHLRNPIGVEPNVEDFFKREFRAAYTRLLSPLARQESPPTSEPQKNRMPAMMAILQCRLSTKGGLWAVQGWLLPVHPERYIPCSTSSDVALCDALLEGGYEFTRLIHYEAVSQRTEPDWLVHNVLGPTNDPKRTVAISVLPRDADAAVIAAKQRIEQDLALSGMPTWTWTPELVQGVIQRPSLPSHALAPKIRQQTKTTA